MSVTFVKWGFSSSPFYNLDYPTRSQRNAFWEKERIIAREYDRLVDSGMPRDEARMTARKKFGIEDKMTNIVKKKKMTAAEKSSWFGEQAMRYALSRGRGRA